MLPNHRYPIPQREPLNSTSLLCLFPVFDAYVRRIVYLKWFPDVGAQRPPILLGKPSKPGL
jgi:hypothetical protein